MKISQSIIKDVINGCCKHYFKLKYIDNIKIKQTQPMMQGSYFESELLGTSRDGKFIPHTKKNGDKYQWVIDVDNIIELAKKVFENSGIKINNVQKVIETDNLIGHIDFESDLLYDIKFTGESFDRWNNNFQYELYETMDIQSRHYQKLLFDSEGLKKDFMFLIFSIHGWFRAILFPFEEQALIRHDERIDTTNNRINELEEPTSLKCSECCFNNICENRVMTFDVENINDLILIS